MNVVYHPPESIAKRIAAFHAKSVFLAGSIEMGKAEDWQRRVYDELLDGFYIYNPRRKDWDSSWEQSYESPQFFQQVTWELNALEEADIILMYLSPGTISPISLLELGLYAESGKLVVVCPEGFHRKGNVDIVCDRYKVPQFDSLVHACEYIKRSSFPFVIGG